ncbi:MAG: N-methyl-L-tryptophan oxidase [Aggregatilineales bacterium]
MYDVIIIGGGIAGISSAYILSQQGQRVLLLEQFIPTHERGSSHGDGRIIRYAYGADELVYLAMMKQAFTSWERLSNITGTPLYQTTGLLNFGAPGSVEIALLQQAFIETDIPYEAMTATDCMNRFPQFRIPDHTEVLYEPSGGTVFADRAVSALWHLSKAAGADCRTEQRVEQLEVHENSVTVKTASGEKFDGAKLVIAAGGWAQHFTQQLDLTLDLRVTQEQLAYFTDDGTYSHAVGDFPNMLDYFTKEPFYHLAAVDGHGVKVGWHHTGREIDAEHPLSEDADNMQAIKDFVRERLPHLNPEPIKTMPCLYTNTPDYHFIMDTHPVYQHIVLAIGMSGHGFKFGTVLGDIVAALLNNTAPPVPLEMFGLARFDAPNNLKRRVTA